MESKESKGLKGVVRHADGHGAIAGFVKFSFLVVYRNA
jgi:hypothetical protein